MGSSQFFFAFQFCAARSALSRNRLAHTYSVPSRPMPPAIASHPGPGVTSMMIPSVSRKNPPTIFRPRLIPSRPSSSNCDAPFAPRVSRIVLRRALSLLGCSDVMRFCRDRLRRRCPRAVKSLIPTGIAFAATACGRVDSQMRMTSSGCCLAFVCRGRARCRRVPCNQAARTDVTRAAAMPRAHFKSVETCDSYIST